jgi:hypothetical protein
MLGARHPADLPEGLPHRQWSAGTTSRGNGTGQLVQLAQVDLHQSRTDPIAGEPALGDVAAQRPCGDVGVGRRRGQADELAGPLHMPCRPWTHATSCSCVVHVRVPHTQPGTEVSPSVPYPCLSAVRGAPNDLRRRWRFAHRVAVRRSASARTASRVVVTACSHRSATIRPHHCPIGPRSVPSSPL